MKWLVIAFCAMSSLFADAVSTASDGVLAMFPIVAGTRGAAILSIFNKLTPFTTRNQQTQVGLQTLTQYGNKGFISNIQAITLAKNGTLLLVGYYPFNSTTVQQYVVLPVEQIVSMIYSLKPLTSAATFGASPHSGTLPVISVDPAERAADIVDIFNILNTTSPYSTALSQVALNTTLYGSYNFVTTGMAPITNGVIQDVQSISLDLSSGGTMLLVNYKVGVYTGLVIVTPDQVYAMVYTSGLPF